MARLIDADELIDFIDAGHLRHPGELCYSETDVVNLLLHAPTVDAVEVVRCRDCKHWLKFDSSLIGAVMCCTGQGSVNIQKQPDDFCSCGERKDGDKL